MLERATSCLKAGARDLSQCAHQAQSKTSRSRRRVLSTFWIHGAGDLELSPLVASMPPATAYLPLRHDSTPSTKLGRRTATRPDTPSPPSNDAFLDFLYPPQALAWLQQSHSERYVRWQAEIFKQLPKHYVPASRCYASRAFAHSTAAEDPSEHLREELERDVQDQTETNLRRTQEEKSHEVDPALEPAVTRSEADQGIDFSITEPRRLRQAALTLTSMVTREGSLSRSQWHMKSRKADVPKADKDAFADSPAHLAEAGAQHVEVDDMRALRRLLASTHLQEARDQVSEVWQLYSSLQEDVKQDVRLKQELLNWLAARDTDLANAHCISLYWSLPLPARDLATYKAALSAFLRRGNYEEASALHCEALENIPNGVQITKELFRNSLRRRDISAAVDVKRELEEAFPGPAAARQLAILWLDASEMPDLLRLVAVMVRHYLRKQELSEIIPPEQIRVLLELSEEALNEYGQQIRPKSEHERHKFLPVANLRTLFRGVRVWSPRSQSIQEGFLMSLLRRYESPQDYQRVHRVVGQLYTVYKESPNVCPPQKLLQMLLQRLRRFERVGAGSPQAEGAGIDVASIVRDWTRYHEQLSVSALLQLIPYYAAHGDAQKVDEYLDILRSNYPEHRADIHSMLWALIYVHARRADLQQATKAFDKAQTIAELQNKKLSKRCWAVMLHAHARARDTAGAFAIFEKALKAGIQPDRYEMQPLVFLLAYSGDVDGVESLLEQYDTLSGQKRTTDLEAGRMQALIAAGRIDDAQNILKETLISVRKSEVEGEMTKMCNMMLGTHAIRRDIESTMRTYRWMKSERIRMDQFTYSALMQALIQVGHTPAANKIMSVIMPREGLEPTAFHYALVIAGFTKTGTYDRALQAHARMLDSGIKDSFASRQAFLKAKAMQENSERRTTSAEEVPAPLTQTIQDLQATLNVSDRSQLAAKGPSFGHEVTNPTDTDAGYLDTIMYIHGNRRCLEAVEEMFRSWKARSKASDSAKPPTIRLLDACMEALYHAKKYDEVEEFWLAAKKQADELAPLVEVPDFTKVQPAEDASETASMDRSVSAATASDRAEIGFAATTESKVASEDKHRQVKNPKPAPGRRHILWGPTRLYFKALARQNRVVDMVTTATRLLSQGYTFNIIVWNRLIEYLCLCRPTLVLLAFTFTERFLINNFPGWKKSYKWGPTRSAHKQQLQYIRARYLRRDQLMPQYRTMLYLARALLQLKEMEMQSGKLNKREHGGLHRLVGSVAQIRERAPKTLAAVESMPNVGDKWQSRRIRSHYVE